MGAGNCQKRLNTRRFYIPERYGPGAGGFYLPLNLIPQPGDVGLEEGQHKGPHWEGGHHLQLPQELGDADAARQETDHVPPHPGPRPRGDPLGEADQGHQELLDLVRVSVVLAGGEEAEASHAQATPHRGHPHRAGHHPLGRGHGHRAHRHRGGGAPGIRDDHDDDCDDLISLHGQ